MRVLGFGTYDTARHPRVGIILDGLRAHGDTVVEVNAPLGFTTAERVAMLSKPWLAYRFLFRVLRRWVTLARAGRRARRASGFDAVVVGYLGHFDVILARLLFPHDLIVLDQLIFAADTAIDRGIGSGTWVQLLGLIDAAAVRRADLVVLDTDEQIELLPARQRRKSVVVPVGSPAAWFAADSKIADGPLRVVFFGLFTPLQGATVIGEALRELEAFADIAMTFVGKGQDWDVTRELVAGVSTVTWYEWVAPAELPGIVAAHHVCLGIFGTTPKAQRVVPNKVYQGAAAGCAIVTSDTPPQRRALGDDAVYVPPGNSGALAKALQQLAADRARVAALREASRRRSAARFTASAIVGGLRQRLAEENRT
jgi:glycosyltransferase involved in cell wall biosynthesis